MIKNSDKAVATTLDRNALGDRDRRDEELEEDARVVAGDCWEISSSLTSVVDDVETFERKLEKNEDILGCSLLLLLLVFLSMRLFAFLLWRSWSCQGLSQTENVVVTSATVDLS